MKFQKKIIAVYMLFSVIVTGIFGVAYYFMSVAQYKTREYAEIRAVSDVKMEKMEDMLDGMSSVITYFLSDVDVLEALQEFSKLDAKSYQELYYDEAASVIRIKLTSYYLIDEYYRTVVFNKAGNVISNTNYGDRVLNEDASYATYPWADEVSGHGGKNVILGMHEDTWGKKENCNVLSVVKEIQGMDMGYVEVQQSETVLNKMFSDGDEIGFIFTTKEGKLLYTNLPGDQYKQYVEKMKNSSNSSEEIVDKKGKKTLCFRQESDTQDVVLLSVTDTDIASLAAKEAFPIVALILAGALVLSLGYVYLTSKQLTRPIRQLQTFMEMTQIDNMNAEIPEKISNDEIEALYSSYRDVLERLRQSMLNEKRMSLLQLQAQFDLLQAQVNPHFIYNVLNVISGRGMMSDDEEICEICAELAGMIRYSTNTKEKYATVEDEVGYTERYLHLLKYRYDYKLQYELNINREIYREILPKIVLQQIVENSVVHGYDSTEEIIQIRITGEKEEDGWYLMVHDSGKGISMEKQEELYRAAEDIRRKLSSDRSNVEMQIGGMGLVNTYARLYLLYNDKVDFIIRPSKNKGTDVIIRIRNEANV